MIKSLSNEKEILYEEIESAYYLISKVMANLTNQYLLAVQNLFHQVFSFLTFFCHSTNIKFRI